MHPVIYSTIPIALVASYFYGLRILALLITNVFIALFVEYLSNKKIFKLSKVSEAAIVTACLYTMTLPASIPFWISYVGMAFGIFFGKMVFGGFGKNVFNPALVRERLRTCSYLMSLRTSKRLCMTSSSYRSCRERLQK